MRQTERFTYAETQEAIPMTPSRLLRAQKRGHIHLAKPSRKGAGGAPECSAANLATLFLYEDLTSMGFSPKNIAHVIAAFEALLAWLKPWPQDPDDFVEFILFDGETAIESHTPTVADDDERFASGGAVLACNVRLYVALVRVFAAVRGVQVGSRYAKLARLAKKGKPFAQAVNGLMRDAARPEEGVERLCQFLGIEIGGDEAAKVRKSIEKRAAGLQGKKQKQ